MPWFRLDDSFHSHPKVIAAGNEAIGLYVRCGTYAAEHLTDGFIREDIAVLYGASDTGSRRNPGTGKPETLAETLIRTKLWRRTRGGWRMPDYLDYNPAKMAVDKERKSAAERQRRSREAKLSRVTHAVTTTVSHRTPTRPDPTRTPKSKPPAAEVVNSNVEVPERAPPNGNFDYFGTQPHGHPPLPPERLGEEAERRRQMDALMRMAREEATQ